jgi:hypothetical protein
MDRGKISKGKEWGGGTRGKVKTDKDSRTRYDQWVCNPRLDELPLISTWADLSLPVTFGTS